jgi:elongation factor G
VRVSGIPADRGARAEQARAELVERVAERDEEVLAAYLTHADVPAAALRAGIRRLALRNELVPVLCGSALRNRGIQPLLDAVVAYLPSPLDVPPMQGLHPKSHEAVSRSADDAAPASALVFKVAADPYVGRILYLRVYSGILRKGAALFNPRTRKRDRVARLLRLHADNREEVEHLHSGEIGAASGLADATTGDTLCAENAPVQFERIRFPVPVMFMALEPKSRADREKLDAALAALSAEDPTCIVGRDPETGQTILSGMGELHLEILLDRMKREHRVMANTGRPSVAYRETVSGTGRAAHAFDREIAGRRQTAAVEVEISAAARSSGNCVEFTAGAAMIPPALRPAVEQGLRDVLITGVLARYPIADVCVRVTGGRYDPESSTDVAFRTAAVMALRDAVTAAGPELLEPIMRLEIETPAEFMGDVLGDVNARRGKVREMITRGGTQVVRALVPLAEMFGYSTAIRSLSKGRASYTQEPEAFDIVPGSLRDQRLNR